MKDYPILRHNTSGYKSSGYDGWTDQQPDEYTFWVQFDEDFEIELVSGADEFPEDSWVRYELDHIGFEFLRFDHWTDWKPNEHVSINVGKIQAMLEMGLIPNQPFAVRANMTYSKQWTDCGYEYDSECDWEIVAKEPVTDTQVAEFLEGWLKNTQKFIKQRTRQVLALKKRQWEDTSALFLVGEWYWAHYYDEMTPPNGYRLHLATTHSSFDPRVKGSYGLMSASSDRGDELAVRANLKKLVAEKFPTVDFDKLPHKGNR